MKTKTFLIMLGILLVLPLIQAQGNITNLVFNQEIPDFIAGETVSTIFTFNYPDISGIYPNQIENALLVFVINISSNNSNYPVWKNDFELNGSMQPYNYKFICSEDDFILDYPFGPVEIENIPDGTFYCTNKEFLEMDLDSINEVTLNIKSNPALWPGEYNFSVGFFYPENMAEKPWNLTIYSPIEKIYGSRRIKFNLTTSKEVKLIEYKNWGDRQPRWRRLCRNCNEYGFSKKKLKSFKEGEHNITIRATDSFDQTKEENILFSIDSKKPRISKTLPRKNKFTNGSNFYIKFKEDNLNEVLLIINETEFYQINTSECIKGKRYTECYVKLNLTEFNGQEIKYWFNVSDFVRSVSSKKTKIKVDTTPPIINNNITKDLEINKRRVTFKINVTEENFDEIRYTYIDNKGRLKNRRLCSRLKEGICEKKRTFRKGEYNLTIKVLDKVGNSDEKFVEFKVDY
ncbi:hypothetical protein KAJ87_00370 [Candidatus Pacearchaeota archaeon]|nr:hypothetical protein [Candidatus Pacearchaeota archaeon]